MILRCIEGRLSFGGLVEMFLGSLSYMTYMLMGTHVVHRNIRY